MADGLKISELDYLQGGMGAAVSKGAVFPMAIGNTANAKIQAADISGYISQLINSALSGYAELADIEQLLGLPDTVENLQTQIDGKQPNLNRTVGANLTATSNAAVTDTGGNLSIAVAPTITAPAASTTQATAGTKGLNALFQTIVNNLANLFSRLWTAEENISTKASSADLQAEASARAAADGGLQSQINTKASNADLQTEAGLRANRDNELQGQITAKLNHPNGSSSQVVRGDGGLINLPLSIALGGTGKGSNEILNNIFNQTQNYTLSPGIRWARFETVLNSNGSYAQPMLDLTDTPNSTVLRDNWIPGTPFMFSVKSTGVANINNLVGYSYIRLVGPEFYVKSVGQGGNPNARKSALSWLVQTNPPGATVASWLVSQIGVIIFMGMIDLTGYGFDGGVNNKFPVFHFGCI
ncbi:hypothetical protein R83H12_00440 [Fibrobacteria bacterium R8-3-H12]